MNFVAVMDGPDESQLYMGKTGEYDYGLEESQVSHMRDLEVMIYV